MNMLRRESIFAWLAVACLGFLPLAHGNTLTIGSGSANQGQTVDIPLHASGNEDVQGLVMTFEWAAGSGTGVELVARDGAGEPLEGADLIVGRVEDSYMVFSVVLDTDGQDNETIPAGPEVQVATARIQCPASVAGTVVTPIRFVENKYATVDGGPTLENLIVSNRRSILAPQLALTDGSFTCIGDGGPGGPTAFACGASLGGDGNPVDASGKHEESPVVTFYYSSAELIQGLSMAVTYDCALTALADSLDTSGGALEEANAEFHNIDIDNESRGVNGDGCEFTFGMLVDSSEPFDGRTLPATGGAFRKLFSLAFMIEDDAMCDHCLWLKFEDGLDGNGTPPVKNLASVDFQSRNVETNDCRVCVDGEAQFIRGDCNFSGEIMMGVNIADAAAAVGFIFLDGAQKFNAPCEDACDANDDGRLDAADVVFILEYLFVPNMPEPPAPGAIFPGSDETADDLGCEGAPTRC